MRASCSIRFLGFVLAGFLLTVLLPRSFAQVQLPVEKVPTFLGIDLPLRPGERLLPVPNSGCSRVVFAPTPELFEALRRRWEIWEWSGACRFGLIHGEGYYYVSGMEMSEWRGTAVYGMEFFPRRTVGGFGERTYAFYSGSAFADRTTSMLKILTGMVDAEFRTLEEALEKASFIEFLKYDALGNALNTSFSVESVDQACSSNDFKMYKPFGNEAKKACATNKYHKGVIVRREGKSVYHNENALVWAKACRKLTGNYQTDCSGILLEAFGRDLTELNQMIAGDATARSSMLQETFDRYAPLEAAVEARATMAAQAKGITQ
jgi:hypothetical protein